MTEKSLPKLIAGLIALILVAIVGFGTWFTTDGGYTYVVQNTLTGSYNVYFEPGTHFKVPFFTKITQYKQAASINFSGHTSPLQEDDTAIVPQDAGNFTRKEMAVNVAFADTYTGDIPATFRFRLPRDEKSMLNIHREFRSFDNLVDSLLTKTARDVIVITSTQYTGEEFFQGGVNQYKVQLTDQLRKGLYETKREQVTVDSTEIAPVSSDNSDASKLEQTRRKVWKNVIQLDANGQPQPPRITA